RCWDYFRCSALSFVGVVGFHFFFFFQAEDGIRDFHVTGVQTCALPISLGIVSGATGNKVYEEAVLHMRDDVSVGYPMNMAMKQRSEERRVGKECRSRGSPYR